MRRRLISFRVILLLTLTGYIVSCKSPTVEERIDHSFQVAAERYDSLLVAASDLTKYPHSFTLKGEIFYFGIDEWTGGFWPGALWYMYEYTGNQKWKDAALRWTASLESNQYNTKHHDIGFMMFSSYGNGLRITGDTSYKPILIQSAKSLCKRYSPTVGSIQSWNARPSINKQNQWNYPVIMDNMMNLELLFWAAQETGDSNFYKVAVQHAKTTQKNHIRSDFGTFHVVNYDTATGAVLHQQTLQGFSDQSTWARGQAWGIYGFTSTFRFTKDSSFLSTAKGLANFFLRHKNLPADKVPLWDFNVGETGFTPDWNYDSTVYPIIPRDVSAAAIAASALFELSTYCQGDEQQYYKNAATDMIVSLSQEPYLNTKKTNPYFLLNGSVGNFPAGREINVPLIYADYYFLEAMHRYLNSKK
ncbi:glycoside hydrolase family 88 protein [Flavihumibacter sp. UBA7668]|uniref:glycoside hydrolase family 88 protein n=1 Tax=Flavihumibacter sp. UBA7668 TaxID=1946542 RepID=UPI0025BA43A2|nr:glycoside hydrolase family 88 protein [Flavihumibacter sp. UBA7668]